MLREADTLNGVSAFLALKTRKTKIFKNYLKINNTNIEANETARMIKERFNL